MSTNQLPAAVTSILHDQFGDAVVAVAPAAGTYASDVAAIITLHNGREVFIKGSHSADRRDDYTTEAIIGRHLPSELQTPTLRGSVERDDWIVLWFDALHAALPDQPWSTQHAEAVLEAIHQRARLLTPCPVPNLRSLPDMIGSAFQVWQDLSDGRPRAVSPADLGTWERENLETLASQERDWPAAVAGNTLCHFDPRADNYLLDDLGRAWTIDWSRGCGAAVWVDLATFLVTLAGDDYDADEMFSNSPVTHGVDPSQLDSHLAALAGYWTNALHHTRPDRTPELLDYQQRSQAGALRWLQQRTH